MVTLSCFAATIEKPAAHCWVRRSAYTIASSRVVRNEKRRCSARHERKEREELREQQRRGARIEQLAETARFGCGCFGLNCYRRCKACVILLLPRRQDAALLLRKFRTDGWKWLGTAVQANCRRSCERKKGFFACARGGIP